MLKTAAGARGFSLIELMVVMTILAFALAMGGPSIGSWLRNLRLRSAAESMLSGLQIAKSEAVNRNAVVRLQFTSSMDNGCALSSTSAFWVINTDPDPNAVAGNCAVPASDAASASPFIIRKHDGRPGPTGMVVNTGGVTSISFNGLGRPTVPAAVNIDVTNPSWGDCAVIGGPVTCLRIVVSPAGQIRMCNPRFALPDPQGC